jgi:hypothetical protein
METESMIDSIFSKTEPAYYTEEHIHWVAHVTPDELQWMEKQDWEISSFGMRVLRRWAVGDPAYTKDRDYGVGFTPPEEIEVLWKLSL